MCVVATICDQGKANEGAIRILNSKTRLYCIQINIEYRDDFYEIDLENGNRIKIIHLFDVLHLLKCVRNNLITKDLVYELDGENVLLNGNIWNNCTQRIARFQIQKCCLGLPTIML